MKVLTIIVNYKTADLAEHAVRGALREIEAWPGSRIVVVDNDSQDGSVETLEALVAKEKWQDRVRVVAAGKNGGFAFGNNLAIRENLASDDPAEYFYLLNPDAVPEPGALVKLVELMDARPDVGIAGSSIHGVDGVHHPTSFRFPNAKTEFLETIGIGAFVRMLPQWHVLIPKPDRPSRVDWLAGASMTIRRKTLDDVGLFDEAFFLYFEETDLCLRAAEAGWPTYYVPDSQVAHVGSASTGMQDQKKPMPTYWFESRRYFFEKHYGRGYLEAANVAWMASTSVGRVVGRLARRQRSQKRNMFRNFLGMNYLGRRLGE